MKAEVVNKKTVKLIKDYFALKNKYIFVILFGSVASGKEKATSDVDIAVAKKENITAKEKETLILDLHDILKRDIDRFRALLESSAYAGRTRSI